MILICSNNLGKIEEISQVMGSAIPLVSLKQQGIDLDVEEDGMTLEDNALKKARAGCAASGFPSIADDTGLFINALNGEPGKHVRRWPGYEAEDEELIDFALNKMRHVPADQRSARFVSVAAYVDPDGNEIVAHGEIMGGITAERTGPYPPGLPFDSIFFVDEYGGTFSENAHRKNPVSHRRQAFESLVSLLQKKGFIS